jgi:hypothetical protein
MDVQEAFTEGDEAGDVKDGVGCELMELNTVYKNQPMKKFVGWNIKAAKKGIP